MLSYKKLWELLIDKDMKKKDLMESAGVSQYVLFKLQKNQNVTAGVLTKICTALGCTLDDICEIFPDEDNN